MKKLIIHIGSHKTGSTSIQSTLVNNKLLLREHNISFFNYKPNGDLISSGNCTDFWFSDNSSLLNYPTVGLAVNNVKKFCKMLSELEGDVLVSAEHFSWIFNKKVLQDLKCELDKYFSHFEIVCYIRRQHKQIVSHHQQGSKSSALAPAKYYGNVPLSIPDTHKRHRYLHI